MRSLGRIFISLATVIILLHSITPHQHHTASQNCDHCLAKLDDQANLLSLLQVIFHPDLGQEHLDNYQNENHEQIALPDFSYLAVALVFVPQFETEIEHNTPYTFSQVDNEFLSSVTLRGPPFMV